MHNACVKTLGNGIRLTCITTEKWKTSLMSASFVMPLGDEGRSLSALLPHVLRSSCAAYPGRREVAVRLDELFGARLEPYVVKRGELQLVGVMADAIDERFAAGAKSSLAEATAGLLSDILLMPQDSFREDIVTRESSTLQARIAALPNNKRMWVVRRMYQLMCPQEAYRLVEYGEIDELERALPELLRQQYEKLLKTAPIELFYCGSMQPEQVEDIFRRRFGGLRGREQVVYPTTEVIAGAGELRRVTEEEAVRQGKLAIGCRTGITPDDPLYPAMILFNACYGGTTGSRLFRTVREEKSLCYYASSTTDKLKGVMAITSGIENENKQKAEDEMLRQMSLLQNGDLTADELEAARLSTLASLYSIEDSPYALENYYQSLSAAGLSRPLDVLMEDVKAVTLDEVVQAAQRTQPEFVYFLKGAAQ